MTRLYLYGLPSPMRPGVLAVLRAHGYEPVSLPVRAEVLAGWGRRPSGERAGRAAARTGKPLLLLEDALLRSAGLGAWGAPPLGLVADPVGIYYDASAPSLVEQRLESPWSMGAAEERRALDAMAMFEALELTKYAMPRGPAEPAPDGPYTVVIDQTAGDASIAGGEADAATFLAMLREALEEGTGRIVVRTHPDVLAGTKRGHLGPGDLQRLGLRSDRIVHHAGSGLHALLRGADRVHAVTSLAGFEARIMGRPVTVHGLPFYAGWGDPGDRLGSARRTKRRDAADIFAAAYLDLPLYLDPHTGEPCGFQRVAEAVAGLREEAERRAAPTDCFGMRGWKHDFTSLHLGGGAPGAHPPGHVRHHRTVDQAIESARARGGRVGWWAAGASEADAARAEASGLSRVAIEDGFLRSRGRGMAFTHPGSLALDGRGIYYDPSRPSDLEAIIERGAFAEDVLVRADALIETFRARGLSKYNLTEDAALPDMPEGREAVLVLGQVENDASIRQGATGEITTNDRLLRAARERHPDGFLIYRPHPDVERGKRPGEVTRSTRERHANALASRSPLSALMERCDHVHTITSLGGLEALMRGCTVHCHGAPFYAGWGLTEDAVPLPRRARRASLREVVAAAYLVYPSYVDPVTRLFCTAEQLAARIEAAGGYRTWGVPYTLARKWAGLLARYRRK